MILIMNYYPPVAMCNNELYIEGNNKILNHQMGMPNNKNVYQGPLENEMYDICYTERTNDSKKMSTLNQQLYRPFAKNIDIDSELMNLNKPDNKCGYNPCTNKRIHCLCDQTTKKKCSFSADSQVLSHKNKWLGYAKIDKLGKEKVNTLRYYDDCNTIPFMLDKIGVKKPHPEKDKRTNCEPVFNKIRYRKIILP